MHIRGPPRTTNQERREHEALATHQHYFPGSVLSLWASLVIRSACRKRATQIAGIVVATVVNIVYSVFCAVTFCATSAVIGLAGWIALLGRHRHAVLHSSIFSSLRWCSL